MVGKELIDKNAGFTLTVGSPEKWNISYNAEGLNKLLPIYILSNKFGKVNILLALAVVGCDFDTHIIMSIQHMQNSGQIVQMPSIVYDENHTSAVLTHTNKKTGFVGYQKMLLKNGFLYCASTLYHLKLMPLNERIRLVDMVNSLT